MSEDTGGTPMLPDFQRSKSLRTLVLSRHQLEWRDGFQNRVVDKIADRGGERRMFLRGRAVVFGLHLRACDEEACRGE